MCRRLDCRALAVVGTHGLPSGKPGLGQRPQVPDLRPDLVERDFAVARPNKLWVADITYISTWTGSLYLAVVVDAWSRRVVGWAMATHLRAELVLDALEMAIGRRRPAGVIHHSDQGSQYTSPLRYELTWRHGR